MKVKCSSATGFPESFRHFFAVPFFSCRSNNDQNTRRTGLSRRGKVTRRKVKGVAAERSILSRKWIVAALLLAFALVSRISTFGDPAIHTDEAYYFLVGNMMHDGAVPYVDVWDRKPLGLFVIYYVIAGISSAPLAYQLAATVAATATAFIVTRIAARVASPFGALLAGMIYLAALAALQGIGGQSPVFYNLPIALAVWLVLRNLTALDSGRAPAQVYLAMFLCGIAITIKQTAIAEAIFLGLFAVHRLRKAGALPWKPALGFVILGAAPFVAIGIGYWAAGHWAEFFHAMVTSNLDKQGAPISRKLWSIYIMVVSLMPLLLTALLAALTGLREPPAPPFRAFVLGWLGAATVGMMLVPNFFIHYALPMASPLAVVSAPLLSRPRIGPAFALVVSIFLLLHGSAFDFQRHRTSIASMNSLAVMMREHSIDGTALVFDAPPYLYQMSGLRPLSPLVFPNHLHQLTEMNVSHIPTAAELQRIIASRPGVVVLSKRPRVLMVYQEGWDQVLAYVRNNCREIGSAQTLEINRQDTIQVFGDCRQS